MLVYFILKLIVNTKNEQTKLKEKKRKIFMIVRETAVKVSKFNGEFHRLKVRVRVAPPLSLTQALTVTWSLWKLTAHVSVRTDRRKTHRDQSGQINVL